MQPLRQLHRWTALAGGMLFLLIAMSGAVLVFKSQLDPALNAPLLLAPRCASPLPLDRLVDAARAAHPDAGALTLIRLTSDPASSARVRFSDGQWIHVDRCSARVLGARPVYGGALGTLSWLHGLNFAPGDGLLLKVTGTAFAALVLAGVVLWWSGGLNNLRRRRGLAGAARQLDWHRKLGFYAAPILLVSTLTGVLQAFSWGAAGPTAPAAPATATHASLAQLLARAETLVPQARRIQIRLPRASAQAASFEMLGPDAPHANALDYVLLDPASGALLRHVPYASHTLAHKLYLTAAGIHYGWTGGLVMQLLLCAGALSVAGLAWTGTASWLRKRSRARQAQRQSARLHLRVARKTEEAAGICSFELVGANGARLPRFEAGAHIAVRAAPHLVRHYSLCNHPRERHRYLICVQHAGDSRGGSRAMHEEVETGDLLEVGLPRNHFPLCPSARRSLLFAGGIGITPILAMAEQLADGGADFELHYFVRTRERAAFVDRLMESPFAARVHLYFSEGQPGGRHALSALLADPKDGAHVYVCGPAGFMDAVLDTARAAGWEESCLHREVFAGAAAGGANSTVDAPFELRLAGSGRVIQVGREQTALDALLAAGLPVPHSCREGVCGSCLIGVIEGRPEHRDHCLSEEERARNKVFAPCCSRARNACLTLDL
ncbi:PepSY domain-containing protein [Massilia litorea]|nr:PepSY domain-containing protein [Massilia litorea]